MVRNDALVQSIKADYRSAPLTERERGFCEFAEKLTVTPAQVKKADVIGLRNLGLTDRDIVDLVQVIAFFNYINRIADGLGVDLESWM